LTFCNFVDSGRVVGRSTPFCVLVHSADVEDALCAADEEKPQYRQRVWDSESCSCLRISSAGTILRWFHGKSFRWGRSLFYSLSFFK